MTTIISSHNKNLVGNKQERSLRPSPLLATVATQGTALSRENAAKRLSFTKPRSHLMAPPNIILGAPKQNLRPLVTITPTPSDIERKEMRQNSQKYFGTLTILAMIKWTIDDRATAYQPGSRPCNLCLTEKLAILLADKRTALNKRSKFAEKCRHQNKY